ncbi:hypothetical protein [Bacillus thuringiensis]|uniref:hypothetical protein n=1 Tax=Bacillus thuringiensis TaxID=1428 RepID=UPI0021004AC8|nr:hypothetical protein [Bacillus thuringiensis]
MSGANKGIMVKNGTNTMFQSIDGNGDYYMFSSNGKTLLKYLTASDTFNIQAANTNVIKKNGDTMTGTLSFDTPNAVGLTFKNGAKNGISMNHKWNAGGTTAEWYLYNWETSQVEVSLTTANGFVVNGKTNLVTKTKDGRVVLTLTSDAINSDSSYLPVVTRRGNSVTLRMAISRNVGSASSLVTTLPVDMRPVDNLTHAVIADDNTTIKMVVQTNGEVRVFTTGKLFNFVTTYTVD